MKQKVIRTLTKEQAFSRLISRLEDARQRATLIQTNFRCAKDMSYPLDDAAEEATKLAEDMADSVALQRFLVEVGYFTEIVQHQPLPYRVLGNI